MSQPLLPNFLQRLYKGIRGRLLGDGAGGWGQLSLGWWKITYLKHLPPGREYRINLFGKPLHFNAPQELVHGLREIFLEQVYRQNLSPNAVILDCGANIGLSLIYLKRCCPGARITAFEPDAVNFSLLEKNVASFGLSSVTLVPAAVWKEEGTLRFASAQGMASRMQSNNESGSAAVRAIRLHDYIQGPVDFLKLDIEGAEFDVLMDIAPVLYQVKTLFFEYHGQFSDQEKLNALLSMLTREGFYYYCKEAAPLHPTPFERKSLNGHPFEIQLNIFCFRNPLTQQR